MWAYIEVWREISCSEFDVPMGVCGNLDVCVFNVRVWCLRENGVFDVRFDDNSRSAALFMCSVVSVDGVSEQLEFVFRFKVCFIYE